MSNQFQGHQSTIDPTVGRDPNEFVRVTLHGKGGYRQILGKSTGLFYGSFKPGDELVIHRNDYNAQTSRFGLIGAVSEQAKFQLESLPGITPQLAVILREGYGVNSKQDLYEMGLDNLKSVPRMPEQTATALFALLSSEFGTPETHSSGEAKAAPEKKADTKKKVEG